MNFEIFVMLLLLIATLVAFVLEVFPIEVTAFGLLGILLLLGFVSLDNALLGLSNKAVVTVGCMFVLSHALVKTGVLEILADRLSHRFGKRKWLGVTIVLLAVGIFSGFLNNTAVVAIFIPLAMNLCHRFHLSPSKVLIPLSYVSILGGTLTLIGTSTNLLVSAMAEDAGQNPIGMFELTKLGVLFLVSGLAYIILFSRRLLPARSVVSSLTRKYHMSSYLTEIKVVTGSKLVGHSCLDAGLSRDYDITVLEIIRNKNRIIENVRDIALKEGDVLIARGDFGNVMRLREDQGIALLHDVKLSDEELAAEGLSIAEALVTSNSSLLGSTLMEVDFHKHFGAFVVAIRRHGATLRSKIAHIPLEFADTLLILAPRERLTDLRRSDDVIILSEVELALRRGRLWWAIFVLIPLIVIFAASGTLDITKGAILATAVLLLGRVVTAKEVYRAVDWSVLFLIAAYVPVGQALIDTGTAQFIASGVLSLSKFFPAELGLQVSISLLFLITTLVTQLISNNAAAIMLVPVSLSIAAGLGLNPRPFLMAICFAASAGFMTPIGYQTNTMVYGPGSYRFFDFTRFGTPLNALFWLMATFLIPYFWPS